MYLYICPIINKQKKQIMKQTLKNLGLGLLLWTILFSVLLLTTI
jgi:hypothetical protein